MHEDDRVMIMKMRNIRDTSEEGCIWLGQWRFWGLHLGRGGSGVAIIAAGGTDLYCHSEPPLTSGKLCFIMNFIGRHKGGGAEFLLGAPWLPL